MTNPTFAQAQQRLAERRLAREAQARARHAAETSASQLRARISNHPSPLLRALGGGALSAWDAASSREGTRPAFRVGQVDAELLDEELLGLLRGQVGDALRYFGESGGGGGLVVDDWSAEVVVLLRAALFKLTVWDHDATYGAALQNLRYTDARGDGPVLVPPSRWQKGVYGVVTVGGRYAWAKMEGWLARREDDDDEGLNGGGRGLRPRRWGGLSRVVSAAESAHAAAALVSFSVFLLHGRYRTLLDRALGMRLAPPASQVGREVSFEYLNRQLVWHAFTEFLLFVLPLVGINKWRRWLGRAWRRTRGAVSGGEGNGKGTGKGEGELAFLPERTCAICYADQNSASTEQEVMAAAAAASGGGGVVGSAATDITNPYETVPCGCVYCFVCLATRIEAEEGEGWTCLRCGGLVRECRPWGGDVLEPAGTGRSPGQGSNKAVMFAEDVKGAGARTETESSQADFVDAVEDMDGERGAVGGDDSGGDVDRDSEEYDEEESELGDDCV